MVSRPILARSISPVVLNGVEYDIDDVRGILFSVSLDQSLHRLSHSSCASNNPLFCAVSKGARQSRQRVD